MPKEDIIRGLEGAMAKGETLERAMYSFYNAGYNKQDVEEAARALSAHLSIQESMLPVKQVLQIQKTPQKKMEIPPAKQIVPLEELKSRQSLQPLEQLNSLENQTREQEPRIVQDVSKYEPKQKMNSRTLLIVILSILLAILVGSLAGIFLFKDTLIKMFSGIF
ncbi:hypothetical protein HY449_03555 [Candidatus Pacearchaeota archaeon]|nr:hypothetical protein [Candidatus Pacearchaeota archaeon]